MKIDPIKRKKYLVPVCSIVHANMLVFANSKEEAHKIAQKDMAESMKRQLLNANLHDFIRDIDASTKALTSGIKLWM